MFSPSLQEDESFLFPSLQEDKAHWYQIMFSRSLQEDKSFLSPSLQEDKASARAQGSFCPH